MKDFVSVNRRPLRRAVALLFVAALLSNSLFAVASGAQKKQQQAAQLLTEEQRIVHALNRLGFGARPGDVERVRRLGVEKYVEQQLNPSQIDDAIVEAKLKSLPTLTMSNSELLAKYPNPGLLIRQLQRRGDLPPDLAAVVQQRNQGQQPNRRPNAAAPNAPQMEGDKMEAPPQQQMTPEANQPGAPGANDNPDQAKYRQAIAKYMRENGMEPPQRIMAELHAARILRAVYSERQLQEVMVDFWSNHFNVFAAKGADRWFLTSYDRDVIRPNALGNFRDLLEATAKSPAMLFYLDNFQSVSPNAQAARGGQGLRRMRNALGLGSERPNNRRPNRRAMPGTNGGGDKEMTAEQRQMQQRAQQPQRPRRGINENYARELMELHTLGVDGGYTQKDVQEVARAFTGWTIADPRGYVGMGLSGNFVFNERQHDSGEKIVLGQKISSAGGIEDGERVLDILVAHPSTAKFVATKLARRFVADEPAPALVERVAAAFTKSKGDIKMTLRAIFTSPEFNSAEARRAKIKTPFELTVSAIRALGAETDARPALHQWIARMGEPLYMYQAPTGYPDTAEHWVNTGALLERLNFALALVSNRIPGTRVDLARIAGAAATSSSAVDQKKVVDQFLDLVLQGDISPKSREVLMKQLSDQASAPIVASQGAAMTTNAPARPPADAMAPSPPPNAAPTAGGESAGLNRRGQQRRRLRDEATGTVGNPEVARIAALIIGSPEFQRQ
jgi:uncharacterized protein (DUF1800 family)